MRIILLIILMLQSIVALADNLLVANCSEGKGCTFELTEIDAALYANMDDEPLGKDEIVVIGKKKDGKVISYRTKKSMGEIDKQWGGDGFTQLGLFNPHIQPKNGTWQATYGASTGNDCYGIGNIGAFIRKQINPGLAGSGEVNFARPFSPYALFPSKEMKFVKTGYNTYRGEFGNNNTSYAAMGMMYYITIVSPSLIETEYHINIKVPTKPACQGRVPVTFKLIKEKKINHPDLSTSTPADDDLLPVNPTGKKDDLLPVKSKDNKDDLLPVEPGKKGTMTHVPRVDETHVPRLED